MVLKELDPFRGGPAQVAGRLAADRLAYHLRRHYRRSRDVDVLNGVRVDSGHAVAEIDHLVLHGHGLVAIQREPTRRRLRVDHDGCWFRESDAAWVAISSPITQAYVQALLLKSLMDRRVHQRGFFDHIEIDVLIVLNDTCILEGDQVEVLAEVCRREEVHGRIEQRVAQCVRIAHRPPPLNPAERRTLGEFICMVHRQTLEREAS